MKWTRRDTNYLTVILLLSGVLAALLFADRIEPVVAPFVRDESQQEIKIDSAIQYSSDDGSSVVFDNQPRVQKLPVADVQVEQLPIVKITPGMMRTELARMLGVSPDSLPPSEKIGVVDDAKDEVVDDGND